jgi:hypothetical protein
VWSLKTTTVRPPRRDEQHYLLAQALRLILARFKLRLIPIDSRTNAFKNSFFYLLILSFLPPGPFAPITGSPHSCVAAVEAVHAKDHVARPLFLLVRFLLLHHVVSHRTAVAVDA